MRAVELVSGRPGVVVLAAAGGFLVVAVRARQGIAVDPLWWELTAQLLGAAALLVRGRPVLVLVVCMLLSLISPVVATTVALYAVGRFVVSEPLAWGAVAFAVAMAFPVRWATSYSDGFVSPLAFVLLIVLPWLVGRGLRASDQAAVALAEKERLLAAATADAVRQTERSRLAREMHDVVAHRISLIVLRANLLETETEDASAREAAESIRADGQAAIEELHDVLRLLRDPDADGLAQHALGEVDQLVNEARDVGQPVMAVVTAAHVEPPDAAERTAVRIVREGLTNAVRHAPGAPTSVLIEDADGSLHVVIANDPSSSPETPELPAGGNGLRGLRERVDMVGGTLEAGMTPHGGFRLEAHLPRGTR
ncbi:sensor histidine kinase [Cellulosimicrobium sp. Marseille-Q8652]